GTNDIDFRARVNSAEELDFLASHVVGRGPAHLSYNRLEAAPAVLCVALEPEEEAPIVYLRLRKAARKHGQRVFHLGQWTTPAVERTSLETGSAAPAAKDNLIPAVPGAEAAVLAELPEHVVEALRGGGVILVGERAAEVPGLYSAVAALGERTGATVRSVPRRAGGRGGGAGRAAGARRRGAPRRGRDPRRRACRGGAGPVLRGRGARRAHRRDGRLGAAPRGRPRRPRRGRGAHAAARRPPGGRRR